MKSAIKVLLIVVGGLAIAFVLISLFFVSQISAVYPPLKEYQYPMSALGLQNLIFNIDKADTNLNCLISDTVGIPDDIAYHMDIRLKIEDVTYDFHIKYNDTKKFWSNSVNSELGLIDVYDSTHKIGGYRPKDNGVPILIDIFEKCLTAKLDAQVNGQTEN